MIFSPELILAITLIVSLLIPLILKLVVETIVAILLMFSPKGTKKKINVLTKGEEQENLLINLISQIDNQDLFLFSFSYHFHL